jgi:hypothetical protein
MKKQCLPVAVLMGLAVLLALPGAGCREAPKKKVTIVDGIEVVSNPALPLHKDPGRSLKVREKLRIRDTGDTFYFEFPDTPQIAPDGSIFFRDRDQLLRFSPDGTFLANLIKPGQGPGEIESQGGYLVEGDSVYVADSSAKKVVHMALDGRFLDERRLEEHYNMMTRDWFVVLMVDLPRVQGVLADATYRLVYTSKPDGDIRKTQTFLGKFFIKPPVFFAWDRAYLVADAGRNLLFVSLSRDYAIKVLDLNEGRVIRSFSRDYPSVPFVARPQDKAVFAQAGLPNPDHADDILELFHAGASVWVLTSIADEHKGSLFDVFSLDGDFLDSFFVSVKGEIFGVLGQTIFVKETAEDGTITIVLYENLESP